MKKIILVDSLKMNNIILENILGSSYQTYAFNNFSDALKFTTEEEVEIVDGFVVEGDVDILETISFIKEVRKIKFYHNTPIIATTQYDSTDEKIQCVSAGANSYIIKPFDIISLKSKMDNLIKYSEVLNSIKLAHHDSLTGLYNKLGFYNAAKELFEKKTEEDEFDYLVLKLFPLKIINQVYGVSEVDNLLEYTRKLLDKYFINALIGRIYSDVFAIIVRRNAYQSADFNIFQNELLKNETKIDVNIHFEIFKINNITNITSFLDYATKKAINVKFENNYSLDIFHYNENDVYLRMVDVHTVKRIFESALINHEIDISIMPRLNIKTNQLIGAEIHARWTNDVLSSSKIDASEVLENDFTLINKLDLYLIEEACKYLSSRHDYGYKLLPISVPISQKTVFDSDLVHKIDYLINKYKVSRDYIHFEIIEPNDEELYEQFKRTTKDLHISGYTLELDGYGRPSSKTPSVFTLPIKVVKIDIKSLIQKIDYSMAVIVLRNLVRLFDEIGIMCICHGVVTEEQYKILKEADCEYAQGNFFSKPLHKYEFDVILKRGALK